MFYEIMYIVPNNYSENEVGEIRKKINALAEKEGFAMVKEESMGKRKLAYPIRNNYFGYYMLTYLKNESGGKLESLGKKIKIMPEILRHQIIKYKTLPEPTPSENIINNPNEISEPAPTGEKSLEALEKSAVPEKEKPEAKKESKKVDLKELDKKLDELLENVDV